MKAHNSNASNTALLKNIIREPFAWPGGYERIAITNDGACLCYKCLKDNFRTILHSTKYMYKDGWQIDGSFLDCEADDAECANCYRQIVEVKE